MHPILRDLLTAFLDGFKEYMPERKKRVEECREWIRQHMLHTTTATRSAYSLKHVMERDHGATHIWTEHFATAARLEGFKVEPTPNGGRIYAQLHKDVRNV